MAAIFFLQIILSIVATPSTPSQLLVKTSNQLPVLAGQLAASLRVARARPFRPETVVVQSQGMARWLKLELARRNGICANIQFQFPKAFVRSLLEVLLGGEAGEFFSASRGRLWRVYEVLGQARLEPEFATLSHYLQHDFGERKRIQLAEKIFHLFDQYQIFRPDLAAAWERGEGEVTLWQAKLWREVMPEKSSWIPLLQELEKLLSQLDDPEALPDRVLVFGISSLPPFYLHLLQLISNRLPVTLFQFQPCQEYWGEIQSEGESARALRRHQRQPSEGPSLHQEEGNTLLALWGKLGRSFLRLLQETGDWPEEPRFESPGGTHRLARLQREVMQLEQPTPAAGVALDDSIQIHSCHSALRELEVLNDHLLKWFQEDQSLDPSQILVMSPDISDYAPFIEAIFRSPEQENQRIPFTIADRPAPEQSLVVQAFLRCLELPVSRLTCSEVLKFLEVPAVQRQFDLTESDLELLQQWMSDTGVRWGKDGTHRTALGFLAENQSSWEFGINRWLAGYAMGGDGSELFHGLLPFAEIEGDHAELLGRFLEFLRALMTSQEEMLQPRPLAEWPPALHRLQQRFFGRAIESGGGSAAIRQVLEELERDAGTFSPVEPIPASVLSEWFSRRLQEQSLQAGFLSGAVTFCSLKPMRTIPARIICLLGMNDGAFPREDRALSFDLISRHPRDGDRSTRQDDQYLFLETILSARDRFYLSFRGQSIRDNKKLSPSILISELIDYLALSHPLEEREACKIRLVVEERLQAFSSIYYQQEDRRYFSFSRQNAESWRRMGQRPEVDWSKLPPPDPEQRIVSLDQLKSFFQNPARFFLQQRAGLRLLEEVELPSDCESLFLDSLERVGLQNKLVSLLLEGRDPREWKPLWQAGGQGIPGNMGEAIFERTCQKAREQVTQLCALGWKPGPIPTVTLEVGGFKLLCGFRSTAGDVRLGYRSSKLSAHSQFHWWLQHLAWNVCDGSQDTYLVTEDKCMKFRGVGEPLPILERLLQFYWEGLLRPLPFYPASSQAYVDALGKGASDAEARAKARGTWRGQQQHPGESEDPYFHKCFGPDGQFDDHFSRLAQQVWRPVQEHQEAADE